MLSALFEMVFVGPQVAAQQAVDAFTQAGYPARIDSNGNSGVTPEEGMVLLEVLGDGELDHAQELGRLRGFELRMHGWVEDSA